METETIRKHGCLFFSLAVVVILIFGVVFGVFFGYPPIRAWYLYRQVENLFNNGAPKQFGKVLNKALAADSKSLTRFRALLNRYDDESFIFFVGAAWQEGYEDRLPKDIRYRFWADAWAESWNRDLGGHLQTGNIWRRAEGGYEVDIDGTKAGITLRRIGPDAVTFLAAEFIDDLDHVEGTGVCIPLGSYYRLVSGWYQTHGDEECAKILSHHMEAGRNPKIQFAIACMLARMKYFYSDVLLPDKVEPILKKWFRKGNPWHYRWEAACEIQTAGIGKIPISFLTEAIEQGGRYRRAALESFAYPYPEIGGLRLRETKFRRAMAGKEDFVFFFRHASPPAKLVPVLCELWRTGGPVDGRLEKSERLLIRRILENMTPGNWHIETALRVEYLGSPDGFEEIWQGKTKEEIWKDRLVGKDAPDFDNVAILPELKRILLAVSRDEEVGQAAFYTLRRMWAFPCLTLDEDDGFGSVTKERFKEWFESIEGKSQEEVLREAVERDMEIILNHDYEHWNRAAMHEHTFAMNRLFVFCDDEYVRTMEERFRNAGLYVWENWPESKRVLDEAKNWWSENRKTVKISKVRLFPK